VAEIVTLGQTQVAADGAIDVSTAQLASRVVDEASQLP
jgi:hypothetical protein